MDETIEESNQVGIINTFESLLDIMYTLITKADIDEKDYRLWYKLHEEGTSTASIGHLGLNAVVMKEDISKLSDNLKQARVGCGIIFDILTRKQLSVNHTKCKYMIVGSNKYREKSLRELERTQ